MLKTLSQQLGGSKAVLATVLLGLIATSQAVISDSGGRAHIDLAIKTEREEFGGGGQTSQNVRVDLGTFPWDSRLLVGDVLIPQSTLVTEVTVRYRPEERNTECVVLRASQGLEDLEQAATLPFRASPMVGAVRGVRIFCAVVDDSRGDTF